MAASGAVSIARARPGRGDGRLVVVGVGGAGVATLAWLAEAGGVDADLVAIDTSSLALDAVPDNGGPPWRPAAPTRILLPRPPQGDASPEAHEALVEGIAPVLRAVLHGADIVFVVTGLAGATGGGAAPAAAALARASGALTIGFGLAPFSFEPAERRVAADACEERLLAACDAVVTLDGDLALGIVGADLPLEWAATAAREVVRQTVLGIADFADRGGCIQVGRADLAHLLGAGGRSCVSIGLGTAARAIAAEAPGAAAPGPAALAVAAALESPFADRDGLGAAARVLCQITGGADLELADVDAAIARLSAALGPGCDLRIGVLTGALLPGTARATVIGAAIEPPASVGVLEFPPAPAAMRASRRLETAAADAPAAGPADDAGGIGLARERPVRALAAAG